MADKDAGRLTDDFLRAGMHARGHTKTEKSHLQIPLVLDPQAIEGRFGTYDAIASHATAVTVHQQVPPGHE